LSERGGEKSRQKFLAEIRQAKFSGSCKNPEKKVPKKHWFLPKTFSGKAQAFPDAR